MGTAGSLTAMSTEAEADLPRSIRRGPPITITCECGEARPLHYGERWTCEKCGHTWNTRRIPLEEYARLRRIQLRFRRVALAIAAVVIATLIALIVLGRAFGGVLVVALAAFAWSTYGRPLYRRRYLKAIADRPSWNIEPE
jgi:hypothetical protein